MSATPQNLAPRDILRQPELFPDPVHYGLAGIAGDLRRYFPDAAVDERAGEALRHLPLRRRQDIVRHYPDSKLNGRPVAFPETKLRNQNYDLEHAYRKAGGRHQIARRLQKSRTRGSGRVRARTAAGAKSSAGCKSTRPAATAPAATSPQRRGTNRDAA